MKSREFLCKSKSEFRGQPVLLRFDLPMSGNISPTLAAISINQLVEESYAGARFLLSVPRVGY